MMLSSDFIIAFFGSKIRYRNIKAAIAEIIVATTNRPSKGFTFTAITTHSEVNRQNKTAYNGKNFFERFAITVLLFFERGRLCIFHSLNFVFFCFQFFFGNCREFCGGFFKFFEVTVVYKYSVH